MKPLFFKAIGISAVWLSALTLGCANEKTTRPVSPTTTTSGVAPTSTTPNNDGSTPTHPDVLPPAHQPDSQPGGPGPVSMEGSPNGSSALSDTTTGPAPHNSSDVQSGTPASMQNGTSAATTAPTMSEADKKTTARIKKALDQSSALSLSAKNVSIETLNGRVTLRGSVLSDRERSLVESEAGKVAGPSHVDDELTITK